MLRYLDLAQSAEALVVHPPLHVLVMIASPHDLPPLDVAQEWQRLATAIESVVHDGLVTLERVPTSHPGGASARARPGTGTYFTSWAMAGLTRRRRTACCCSENELGRGVALEQHLPGTLPP